MEFFFEIVKGKPPIPLLPVDRDGRPRFENARQNIFQLAEAVKRSGQSERYLKDLWVGTWGEFLAPDALTPPPPGTFHLASGAASLFERCAFRGASIVSVSPDESLTEIARLKRKVTRLERRVVKLRERGSKKRS